MTEVREWTFPASYAQERVWFANQHDVGSPVHNVSSPWTLPAGLTREQVTAVFAEVVARHEALRSCLRLQDGVLLQVVRAVEPIELPVDDLRELPDDERVRRTAEIAGELS